MRSARDTFLHYLADNLSDLTVNYVRKDSTTPNSDKQRVNAVNVWFINDILSTHISRLQVSMDVLFYDENEAIDAVQKVVSLLHTAAYTQNMDYTDPDSPVATGTNIYWNPFNITFKSVGSDIYYHYSCTLAISHHNS